MGDASAYQSLGLEPGADQAAIERAYKRLIKEHHPDREGGNSARAAEINHAYRQLRWPRPLPASALELNDGPDRPRTGFGWMIPALGVAAALAAWILTSTTVGAALQAWSPAVVHSFTGRHLQVRALDPMDKPLEIASIEAAIRDARQVSATGDEMALAAHSGDCHRRLRSDPKIAWLDRCSAFDDAVVEIQDRDPLRDRGPFSELSVTGRQWSSASELSTDYLAIDGRLARIRLHVQLAMVPAPIAAD
ncbi:MAG: J domain-containing protein [Sphingomicrobium sp.]